MEGGDRVGNPVVSDVREYYEESYHFDEDVERPNFHRLWRALRLLEPLRGAAFLDLGSGVGWATNVAIERGGVAFGVGLDFSARALASAKRFTPRGSWVHADGTRLPFADGSFDRAFSFGSLEHFPDVRAGFAELYRVLKPSSLAVVVVPNFWVRTEQPLEFRATRANWTAIATAAGFTVVSVGTDRGPAIFKNRRPLKVLLRLVVRLLSLIPALRYQFIFVLRKAQTATTGA
jgi:SAM-dependent methyltransferase